MPIHRPLLLFLSLLFVTSACPTSCSCKWRNGKQTVSCENKSLPEIPDGLDPTTQVLAFTGNALPTLTNDLFVIKQLINLQRIHLSHCQIRTIAEKTFNGLTNLVELDLSNNFIEAVPTASFFYCPSLMRLTLTANPIKKLSKLAFNHLSFLNTLELNACALSDIQEGAFHGLHSLEWLQLNNNKLESIPGRSTLPGNLKGAEFGGNPWRCDCHILGFHAWLHATNIPVTEEPTCTAPPRLLNRGVKSVPIGELACLPEVSPTTLYLELNEGKNLSLQCQVHAIPEAAVSWFFRGHILQNNTSPAPGIRLIYYLDEGSEYKRSELLIYNANSEDNGTFICHAENSAGTAQSNFTIRIIIKEEPMVIIVAFPVEYLMGAAIGAGVLLLVIVAVCVVSILRCRRRRKLEEKRNKTKDIVMMQQQPTDKCEELGEEPLKLDDEEMFEAAFPADAFACYQIEQNPDLINGMERHRAEEVRWMDSEGYPPDYGLPKPLNGYYRTLPLKKRPNSGISRGRYSQEAEFLARRVSPGYDNYHSNIRYTADGYPVPVLSDGVVPACCSMQWPLVVVGDNEGGALKRCVGAQTEEGEEEEGEKVSESPDEGYEGEPAVV